MCAETLIESVTVGDILVSVDEKVVLKGARYPKSFGMFDFAFLMEGHDIVAEPIAEDLAEPTWLVSVSLEQNTVGNCCIKDTTNGNVVFLEESCNVSIATMEDSGNGRILKEMR